VVYFAASGDTGGQTIYPGVSPNVVSAGGTTINRDSSLATSLVRRAGAEAAVAPVNMSPVPRTRTESLQSLESSGAHRTFLLTPTPTRGSRCTTAPHARGSAGGWFLVELASLRHPWQVLSIWQAISTVTAPVS